MESRSTWLGYSHGSLACFSTALGLRIYEESDDGSLVETNSPAIRGNDCLALEWAPDNNLLLLISINSKLQLASFQNGKLSQFPLKDLPRQISTGFLHHNNFKYFAYGYYPKDSGITVMDYERFCPITSCFHNINIQSMCWTPDTESNFVVGYSNGLSIFDINSNQKIATTSTNTIYGLCMHSTYLACFCAKEIRVYDTRNFEKVVWSQEGSNDVFRLAWKPLRQSSPGILGTLRQIEGVGLLDFSNAARITDDAELLPLERSLPIHGALSGFAWHPYSDNTFFTCNDGMPNSVKYGERPTVCLSGHSAFARSISSEVKFLEKCDMDDISEVMYDRVLKHYGLGTLEETLKTLDANKIELIQHWNRLYGMRNSLVTERCLASKGYQPGKMQLPGVVSIMLQKEFTSTLEDLSPVPIIERRKFCHSVRVEALVLCGWKWESKPFSALVNISNERNYTRSATLSIFSGEIRHALTTLENAKNSSELEPYIMALSGYHRDNEVWRERCRSAKISDPYLKAAFQFLTRQPDEDILNCDMLLDDKIAYACKFLEDDKLLKYLHQQQNYHIKHGLLDGLLLTGLTKDGLDLLQSYLDRTGDVQTVAFSVIHGVGSSKDSRVRNWLNAYTDILDTWRLWEHRCLFDSFSHSLISVKNECQISVVCHFCKESICRPSAPKFFRKAPARIKPNACPSCKKPLPRCAVCLQHMSSLSLKRMNLEKLISGELDKLKSPGPNSFDRWFCWCQRCKHGGHAGHMSEWFQTHTECPVTGCSCQCQARDVVGDFNCSVVTRDHFDSIQKHF